MILLYYYDKIKTIERFGGTCYEQLHKLDGGKNYLKKEIIKRFPDEFDRYIEVFGGASWNVNVSELEDKDGNAFKSSISPYHTFNKTYNDENNVKMYPGFTAGIRF